MTSSSSHSFAAFKTAPFRLFFCSRLIMHFMYQMTNVAIAQYVYDVTHDALALGYVGLALFLPRFGWTFPAGHVADRFERNHVILACRCLEVLAVAGLLAFFFIPGLSLLWLYVILFFLGTARAFDEPAAQAVLPQIVPAQDFGNAVTWSVSTFNISVTLGPLLAGWIYAVTGQASSIINIVLVMSLASLGLMIFVHVPRGQYKRSTLSWQTMTAGLKYVFNHKVILGCISLDLFAVLLGGAVALLPIYANEILHEGPTGLGILRAAPAVGATIMTLILAKHSRLKMPGLILFFCVAIFGVATILFGVSKHFWFSVVCLVILGAFDMVSVVIRGVLIQLQTPPEMRGRVSAVNYIFIGASNELGEFESGLTASWLGVVPAVVLGGVGTLVVVGLWFWLFPELRRIRSLEENGT